MAHSLVIVESPAKAKTIAKHLGRNYIVKASMGHVIDLPKSQLGVDIKDDFAPKYITIRGKGDILKDLKSASRKAGRVYLAADPDREGEAIAWHLAKALGLEEDAKYRVVFNEITKDAIKEAFKNPREIDINLVNAQQARRILDRLVGYQISPLLWKKVKKGLSAGRVQSVALKMINDRENEILAFVPTEYWSLTLKLAAKQGEFAASFFGYNNKKYELNTKDDVDVLLASLAGAEYTIDKIKKSERKRNPAPSFITSTLQQEAARKLNFRAAKTMMIAQQLYEGINLPKIGMTGLITYMRTDSVRISDSARDEAKQYITEKYGVKYLGTNTKINNKKGAQDAHEAIRPTSILHNPESLKEHLSRDQYRLYTIIWERFIASQMAVAVYDTVAVDIIAGSKDALFRANGSTVKFSGFMKVYIEGKDDANGDKEESLPVLTENEKLKLLDTVSEQHFTQPPPRYTEARLVKTMEELGIGRPSTYAPTLDTIQKRGYVRLDQKRFVPTELGKLVNEMIEEFFANQIKIEFTAELEEKLDLVETGELNWEKLLREFYVGFEADLKAAEEEMKDVELKDEVSDEICEKCGRPMVYKLSRYGKFLGCSGFPECRNIKSIVNKIDVPCPKCGSDIIVRKGKKKSFYGCSAYPNCDYISFDKPVSRPCPSCNNMMVEKYRKSGNVIKCTECDYTEEMI